jgi:hypothetical protein
MGLNLVVSAPTEGRGGNVERRHENPTESNRSGQTSKGLTMAHFPHRFGMRALAGILALGCVVGAAVSTKASTAYDGNWNVVIQSASNECRTSRLALRIENGTVGYAGYVPVSVSGSVGGNGSVTVSVVGGGRKAAGSGQLSGNSGAGTWTGSSSSAACSGTWTARRT